MVLSLTVTSRVCYGGNVFVVSVCMCQFVYLSVSAITFEAVDIETSFFGVVVHLDNI